MYIYTHTHIYIYIYIRYKLKQKTVVQKKSAPVPSKQSEEFFMRNFVLTNMETICTVACRDSGKTVIDAMAPWPSVEHGKGGLERLA